MQTDIEIPEWLAQKVAFEGRYAAIPPTTQYTLRMWVLYAQTPGGFVEAVLRNDLHGAFNNADDENSEALPLIMSWIHNECPQDAWLSPGNRPDAPAVDPSALLRREARRDALIEHIRGVTHLSDSDAVEFVIALASSSQDSMSYRDAGRKQLYKFKGYCRG